MGSPKVTKPYPFLSMTTASTTVPLRRCSRGCDNTQQRQHLEQTAQTQNWCLPYRSCACRRTTQDRFRGSCCHLPHSPFGPNSSTCAPGMHGHARDSSSQQTTHHCEQYSTRSSFDISPAMTPPMNSLPCREAAHQFLSTNTSDPVVSLEHTALHIYDDLCCINALSI